MELLTSTPVVKLTRNAENGSSGGWIAQTTGGIIRAQQVVLATNAYTAFLRDEFRGSIIPLRGQITAQRPGLHMPEAGLTHTYSFVYNGGYDYMITRPPGSRHAGDLLIGGGFGKSPLLETGNTDDGGLNPQISAYLADSLRRYIGTERWGGDHPDERIKCEWSGIMGYTSDGNPFVGKVSGETGLWISAGFQGHGMVSCWMCAWALVLMMGGKGGSESLRNWFPRAWEVSEARLNSTAESGLYVKKIERKEQRVERTVP
jgi:glycine/D-amino acid oxidase-like deaminating enzyme